MVKRIDGCSIIRGLISNCISVLLPVPAAPGLRRGNVADFNVIEAVDVFTVSASGVALEITFKLKERD